MNSIAPVILERAVEHLRTTIPSDADEVLGEALDRLFKYLELNRPMLIEIKTAICEFYGLEPRELVGRYRQYETALARQIFCFLAYRYTRFSMQHIGRQVGLKDHSTVWHAIRKIEKLSISKPLVADDLDLLRLRISEKMLLRASLRC